MPEKGEGTELEFTFSKIRRGDYLVIGTNVSKKTLYLPYAPARGKDRGHLMYVNVEKQNGSGTFEPEKSEYDSADRSEPLLPGEVVEYHFYEKRRGTFRLEVGYLVDPTIVNLLNDPECLFKISKENSQTIIDSWVSTRTGPIDTSR